MAEWPLVGRASELKRLDGLLSDGAGGAVLAGPPGVGKTRLGIEALALAATRGRFPLRITATQTGSALPFGAFAAHLPELTADVGHAEMLNRIAAGIANRGDGTPVVVLVDDAHVLDDASAALTHHLVTSGAAFVIATVRSTEPASDAIVSLWKDGLAERLDLRPLSSIDVEALLVAGLGGTVDAGAARVFWERTEGNALFLRELVLGALDAGALTGDGGVWRIHGALPPSARLIELVETRLEGLDSQDREVLALLALGEPLGASLLLRLAPAADLDRFATRGVVRIEQNGRRVDVRLGHPMYGDVLRARLSPLRTQALSRALADGLASTGARRREDVLRLATWRLAGGGGGDPELMLAGAHQAHDRNDLTLAEGLGRAAWEADNSFDAGLFLAIVISHAGCPEEAETVFASVVMQAATDGERAALAVSRSQNFLFLRRFDEAIACAEAAEATIGDPAARAEVAAQRAPLLGFAGRAVEARALVDRALPDATGRAGAVLGLVGSMLAAAAGQATEAIRLNDVARTTSLSLDTPLLWHPAIHRFVPLDALSLIGKVAEAEDLGQRWYTEAIDNDAVLEQAYVACGLAKTLTRQGRVGGAARWAELADRLFGQAGRPAERSYALVYVAHALALGGSPDGARAALDEYGSLPGSGGAEFGAEVLQARAWTLVAEGDIPSAIDHLVEAAELARSQSSPAVESMVRHDLARLGRATEVADRLAALAPLVEGTLAQHRAAHAAALSTGDGSALDAAAEAFEKTGALLLAAEAATAAATAWQRSGDGRKATFAERRAATLAAACEGARTPALEVSPIARVTLTPRELEVASLAARGLSNKEIAARLFLSTRTVENKLHTTYEKLGIEGRGGLAAALKGY